jgi:hypothetical protein
MTPLLESVVEPSAMRSVGYFRSIKRIVLGESVPGIDDAGRRIYERAVGPQMQFDTQGVR